MLLDWLQAWQLDTYVYAPKDDLKHRILWRELLDAREAAALKLLLAQCQRRGLRLVYALAPGLDMVYARPHDSTRLQAKNWPRSPNSEFAPLRFVLTTFRSAYTRPINGALARCPRPRRSFPTGSVTSCRNGTQAQLWFCPTAYCKRWPTNGPRDGVTLEEIGAALHPNLEIFWTGPAIISRTISAAEVQEVGRLLQRKPLLWDNLHANDYDRRLLYLGPYAGRPRRLRERVRGILLNPNCQFEANFVPVKTLAEYPGGPEGGGPGKLSGERSGNGSPGLVQAKNTHRADSPSPGGVVDQRAHRYRQLACRAWVGRALQHLRPGPDGQAQRTVRRAAGRDGRDDRLPAARPRGTGAALRRDVRLAGIPSGSETVGELRPAGRPSFAHHVGA